MKRSYRFIGGPLDGQVAEVECDENGTPPRTVQAYLPTVPGPIMPDTVTYYRGKRRMGGVAYTYRPEDIAEIFDSGSSGPPS